MSFNASSNDYAPPPPRRGMSPWAWLGIGCGFITLLGFGGCVFMGYKFTQAMNNGMSPEESEQALQAAQIPLYPGSNLDPQSTKAAGAMMGMMSSLTGGKMVMAAYRCPDTSDKVLKWYADKLPQTGYNQGVQETKTGMRDAQQIQYMRGKDEIAMIQTQAPQMGNNGCVLILAHMKGIKRGNRRM